MTRIHSADRDVVTVHYCWPIGVYNGVSQSVAVRQPRKTERGTLWMRTVWYSRTLGARYPSDAAAPGFFERYLTDMVD